jgi:hypothetical protein
VDVEGVRSALTVNHARLRLDLAPSSQTPALCESDEGGADRAGCAVDALRVKLDGRQDPRFLFAVEVDTLNLGGLGCVDRGGESVLGVTDVRTCLLARAVDESGLPVPEAYQRIARLPAARGSAWVLAVLAGIGLQLEHERVGLRHRREHGVEVLLDHRHVGRRKWICLIEGPVARTAHVREHAHH